jgi:lipoate-protein ligase A
MSSDGWRLIDDGLCDGDVNMATDRAILQACHEEAQPTLRFYGWKSPTLTVGYSQNVDRDVDQTRCRDLGVSLVRRPTGGRAILHHMEFTYCVVAPLRHPRFPANLRGTYRVIAETLFACMMNLGVHSAVISKGNSIGRGSRSPSCFSSISHSEISVNGRKLIGSAQRRTPRAFLQHGSIIIDCDTHLLNSLFLFKSPEAQGQNLQQLREGMITLREIREEIGFEDVRRAFLDGFCHSFAEGVTAGKLTSLELKLRDGFLGSVLL